MPVGARAPTREQLRRLYKGLSEGRLELVARFFRWRPAADISKPFFRTLLHMPLDSALLYGEDPPQWYDGGTCLHVCAWRGHVSIVEWLLQRGASLEAEDAYGRRPVHVATPDVRVLLTREAGLRAQAATREGQPEATPKLGVGATPYEHSLLLRIKLPPASMAAWSHQECAVCFSAFADRPDGFEVTQMPVCKHVFCTPCLERWLGSHSSCPMCRAQLADAPAPQELALRPVREPSSGL